MLKIVLRTSAQRMRQNSALPGRRSREWRRPWRNSGRRTKLCGSALPSKRDLEMEAYQQQQAAYEQQKQAAAQAAASVRAEGSDKLQQLTRKLEAAHAEIRRYQTRLFACERQMIALRRENADLEAACEQAREELQMAVARAEKAEQQAAQRPACPEVPVQAPTPEPPEEAVACCARPAAQPAAQPEPVWQPETELEKLSVELLRRFDEMMQE